MSPSSSIGRVKRYKLVYCLSQKIYFHRLLLKKARVKDKTDSICIMQQESRAVAREPRDVAAVVFWIKFANSGNNIHYKFESSQASKARLHSSKRTGAKQNLTQNGNSKSRIMDSVERR